MLRVKAKLVEKNKAGYARFVSELGGLSAISLGVQGAEASKPYPDRPGVTVGDVARWHELGEVPGAPARAWLSQFMDANEDRLRLEAREAMQAIVAGASRKVVSELLAKKWAGELRDFLYEGEVQPPLTQSTIDSKSARHGDLGAASPLVDTGLLASSATGKAKIRRWRSVPGGSLAGFARRMAENMLDWD